MSKQVRVSVFPGYMMENCTSCNLDVTSCTNCSSGSFQAQLELMEDIYFMLEEIGYKLGREFVIETIDTGNTLYSIERINVMLVSMGETPVNHETYAEYIMHSVPLIAVNNKIVSIGEIPKKEKLLEKIKRAL